MKFRVTMKDPDSLYDAAEYAAKDALAATEGIDDEEREMLRDARSAKLRELAAMWFEYGEYLTVEIDTEAESIRVVPRGEA